MSVYNTGGGYLQVMLSESRLNFFPLVHHMIAAAFFPTPTIPMGKNGSQINHKNGNNGDNRIENLEWVTANQNHFHAVGLGLQPSGERVHTAKLNREQVREIRKSYPTKSLTTLARQYNVTPQNIFRIVHHLSWKCV
jgi:hypothetical protein